MKQKITITVQGDATITVTPVADKKKKKEESTEGKPKLLTEDMPLPEDEK